jgi:hypothetical protein
LPSREGFSDESSLRSDDLRGLAKSFESPLSENLEGRFASSLLSRENGFSLLDEKPEPSVLFLKLPAGLSDDSSLERLYGLPPRVGFEKDFEPPLVDLNGFFVSPRAEDRSPRGESEREDFERAPLRPAGFFFLPSPELSRLGIWFF